MNSNSILTKSGKEISYCEQADTLSICDRELGTQVVIDLGSNQITIRTSGDIELNAGGKLKLRGAEGVEIDGGDDVRLTSSEETIIRGKMVRIN
jgi:hypothetical protein